MSLFVYPPISLSIAASPMGFTLDGVQTPVLEDTATPSNNTPLPVKITSSTGDINITAGDLSVQLSHAGANYDSARIGDGTNIMGVNASLEALIHDADSLTELQAILAKIIAAPATEAKQDAILTALGTSSYNERVIENYYSSAPTIPTATRLDLSIPVPASHKATQLEIVTKSGDNFTAYDASTGGNVIARFTQAGSRIPVNLVATTEIHLQSDTGSNITASDLTVNVIGVPV